MNIEFKSRSPIKLDTEQDEKSIDLHTYVNFLWRNWFFIGAVVALALVVGFIYLASATPMYRATAQLLLDPQRDKSTGVYAGMAVFQYDYSPMDNQIAIIKSDPLLRRVVIKERLALPPAAKADVQDSTSQTPPEEDPKAAQRIQAAINHLRGALSVGRVGQSNAFTISVIWDDPERAAQLANAIGDAYIVDQLDARFEAAKRTSAWLSERLVELRKQLRDSEEAVAKFRKENGLVRSGPNVTLNDQQFSDLNSKVIGARADAAEKKTRVDFIDDVLAGKKKLDTLPDSFQSQTGSMMGQLRGKLAEVSQREADLLARYSSLHPAVVNVAAEKRDIERSIAAETQRVAQTVRSEYALAKARQSALEQALDEVTGQGGLDSDAAIRLRELERNAAVNKNSFRGVPAESQDLE